MKLVKQFFIFMMIVCPAVVYGQFGFNVHTGVALPQGDYASTSLGNGSASGASTGFNLGVEYHHQLVKNFGMFVGFDYFRNGVSQDLSGEKLRPMVLSTLPKAGTPPEYSNAQVEYEWYEAYNHVPISIGVMQVVTLSEKLHVYGKAGLSVNYTKVSDTSFKVTEILDDGSIEKLSAKTSKGFVIDNGIGYKLGAGVVYNDKVSLFVNYHSFSKQDGVASITVDGFETEMVEEALKMDMLTIGVAVFFGADNVPEE